MPKSKIIKTVAGLAASLIMLVPLYGCISPSLPLSATQDSIQNTISVSGTGIIKIAPDQVLADISVVTEKATTQDAVNTNGTISNMVIEEVKKIAAKDMTVETIGYNLVPLYDYTSQADPPKLYAYQVTSTIRVKTTDIAKIGEIIAAATQAGATAISSVGFDLTDTARKKAVSDVLAIATKDAADKAGAIADSMGLKVSGVLYINESSVSVPGPFLSLKEDTVRDAAVVAPTILPTEIEVAANITIVFMFGK